MADLGHTHSVLPLKSWLKYCALFSATLAGTSVGYHLLKAWSNGYNHNQSLGSLLP
jgi:hypothetical protein